MTDLRRLKLTRIEGTATLSCEISPCCFMYPNYGLQIGVSLNGSREAIKHGKVSMTSATGADVQALFDSVKLIECGECKGPAFDPATISTNARGLCPACMEKVSSAEFEEEMKLIEERERVATSRRHAHARARGFTHEVIAWLHPESGDDEAVIFHTKTDAKDEIEKILRKHGSVVTSDFTVTKL